MGNDHRNGYFNSVGVVQEQCVRAGLDRPSTQHLGEQAAPYAKGRAGVGEYESDISRIIDRAHDIRQMVGHAIGRVGDIADKLYGPVPRSPSSPSQEGTKAPGRVEAALELLTELTLAVQWLHTEIGRLDNL